MGVDVFESKKIKEAIYSAIRKHAHEKDATKIMNEILGRRIQSEYLIKQISEIIRRYFTTQRTMSTLLLISENLKKLIDVQVTPTVLEMHESDTVKLRVYVANNCGIGSRFSIKIEQDHKDSPLFYSPIKGFNEAEKEMKYIIDTGKGKLFVTIIKGEVFGIKEVFSLKKQGKVEFNLKVLVENLDINGIKQGPIPVKVIAYKKDAHMQ